MSFGLNGHDLPAVSDFAQAVSLWRGIKPLKNHDENAPRPIGRRESRNPKTVRAELDPETGEPAVVIFRYHHTDCVTWHDDGICEIEPWHSRSTAEFINHFAPRGVYFNSECISMSILLTPEDTEHGQPEDRCYLLEGTSIALESRSLHTVRPLPDAEAPAGTTPIKHVTVNRKGANALYKRLRVQEFERFMAAYFATSGFDTDQPHGFWQGVDSNQIIRALKAEDRDGWPDAAQKVALIARWGTRTHASTPETVLRSIVRTKHPDEAFTTTEVPYAQSHEALMRMTKTYYKKTVIG